MRSVLLVDDDDAVRDALGQLLTREGWQVHSAGLVDEAERIFTAQPCDVVLSDLVMPERDAFDLLTSLRQQDPRLVVVVMSGFLTDERFKEVLQAGACDCLHKPCEADDLIRALTRAILLRDCLPTKQQPSGEHTIIVNVPAQLKERTTVMAQVDLAAQAGGYDLRRNRILMALDEAFTNAVIHGAAGNRDCKIEVRASFSAHGGVVTVSDPGPGFDPAFVAIEPDEMHRERGLYLLRAACDDVRWLGRGNVCQMVFRQPPPEKQRSSANLVTGTLPPTPTPNIQRHVL